MLNKTGLLNQAWKGMSALFFAGLLGAWECLAQAAPTPRVSRNTSFETLVQNAYHAGLHSVVIPPAEYHLPGSGNGQFHARFSGMHDFDIDARGAHLFLDDSTRGGLMFVDCRNVTFRGATLEYTTSPATQGKVEAIAPDGSYYDVRIDKGYPVNLDNPDYFKDKPTAYLFDRTTRWWKPGAYDLYAKQRAQKLAPDLFRLTWQRPLAPPLQPVAVGDLIAFRGAGRQMLEVTNSALMRMDDLTIFNAPGMAVREEGGAGGNHYTVTVKRGQPPPGATEGPLLSSTADGFHSAGVRKGPVVENSYFEAMTDDGIAIHGHFSLVLEAHGDQMVINQNQFLPGDPLELYDVQGRPAGTATVKSIAGAAGFKNTRQSSRVTRKDHTSGPYVTLTLDRPLKADFDYLVDTPNALGAGFILRHNRVMNHRARGLILKSRDGLVEDNVVDGSTIAAVLMMPELWWNEAGYDQNIVLRHNTFAHAGYAPRSMGAVILGAFDEHQAGGNGGPIDGFGNKNIVFEDNKFVGNNIVNLVVASADGVSIRNNIFTDAQQVPQAVGRGDWGEDAGALIVVAKSQGVELIGNQTINLGKGNRELVQVLNSQVSGAADGVKKGK